MAQQWRATISEITPLQDIEVGRWPINLSQKQVENEAYEELGLHYSRYLNPANNIDVTLKVERVNEVI
jgi:hypothetical protein